MNFRQANATGWNRLRRLGNERRRLFTWIGLCLIGCLVCMCEYGTPVLAQSNTISTASKDTLAPSRVAKIRLKNDDFADGWFSPSSTSGALGWKNANFVEPFEFVMDAVRSVDMINPEPTLAKGKFNLQLHDGDTLWGDVVSWKDGTVVFESSSVGRLNLDESSIRYLRKWREDFKVIYQGPHSLKEWTTLDNGSHWSIESGTLVTKQAETKIRGNVGLPDRCQIDFRLSWNRQPSFVLSLGVSENQTAAGNAYSIEVWDDKLALVRQYKKLADAAFLEPIDNKAANVKLTVFLDQVMGRAVVYSETGKQLADLTLAPDAPESHPCILLANYGRELRLDQLSIQPWTDQLPVNREGHNDFVVDAMGKVHLGKIRQWNLNGDVVIASKTGEDIRMSIAQVAEIGQSPPPVKQDKSSGNTIPSFPKSAVGNDNQIPPPLNDPSPAMTDATRGEMRIDGAVTLTLRDQTRLNGHWLSNDHQVVHFQLSGGRHPVSIPLSELHSIRGSRPDYKAPSVGKREGRLTLPNLQLMGYMVPSLDIPESACIRWQPRLALSQSQLGKDVEAQIDFRRVPVATNSKAQPMSPTQLKALAANGQLDPRRNTSPKIELRAGDLIPAEVVAVDEKGVTFKSPFTSKTFVPNDQVQSVDLHRMPRVKTHSSDKINRLLTVPRSKKNDPPTHLVTSTDGDHLRGRVIGMADGKLEMEVKSQSVQIDSGKLARIVWLHDRDWEKQHEPTDNQNDVENKWNEQVFQVHCVDRNGLRMTFSPTHTDEEYLKGTSPTLGECSAMLSNLEILLVGKLVSQRARELNSNPWTLALAKLPKIYEDEGEDGSTIAPGTLSPLVGKPAPKLEADQLDGKRFRLSEMQGKIVVLDFWASWCGPCMQTMPAVDAAVKDIAGDQATLIAVNLEEPAERAQAALDRLKLETIVALDHDGVAAQRFQANAIPQTVIVDREGVVRYVFVGGGNRFIEQFGTALREILDGNKAAPTP